MIDHDLDNKKSIKYHVKEYLTQKGAALKGQTIIDIPAGNGATSSILNSLGATVKPFDLFPEYFMVKELDCQFADVVDRIPVPDQDADMLICQEGIEHFSDQLGVFKEFNRVLQKSGQLIITTPSYSCLAAKFNYLLLESETSRKMPPNEIDDIWMSDKSPVKEIYYGHIFLIGLQKLRTIGKLSGFDVEEVRYVRLSKGSLFLFPFLYPLIVLRSLLSYFRHMRKDKGRSKAEKRAVYREQLLLNITPKHLLNRHIFMVFRKKEDLDGIQHDNQKMMKPFDQVM